jgi:MFS family permease
MKAITRVIWILSLISLFNDVASEMLIPIMPLYLKSIGFSVFVIGLLEGFAEAFAGISKGYFGRISDNMGKRAPFVRWGYALSAIAKPMIVFIINPFWVLLGRTFDKLGKGLRTGARDAILSDESDHSDRGKVFGFHRSMDTVGAAIGPSIALIFLFYHPANYRTLFLFSIFPGIVAVALTFFIKDKERINSEEVKIKNERKPTPSRFFPKFDYWKRSSKAYKSLVIGLLFFTLFNSSDAFLILKMKESGTGDLVLIGIYVFYNVVYALTSFPVGIIADKIGLKKIFIIGLVIFAFVYFGMSRNESSYMYIILLFFYGLFYSCNEGISKAWISKVCERKDTATAIGMFSGLQSIATLIASSLAGFIWVEFGSFYTFVITGFAAVLVAIYIWVDKTLADSVSR